MVLFVVYLAIADSNNADGASKPPRDQSERGHQIEQCESEAGVCGISHHNTLI